MKRDNEMLRSLLIGYERQDDWMIHVETCLGMTPDELKREHHTHLLCDAGFLAEVGEDTYRITNQGHDFLEAIRNDDRWSRIKEIVVKVGGNVTTGLIFDIAIGLLKTKIKQHTGLEIG